jgi:type I restriction enzyme S subunit
MPFCIPDSWAWCRLGDISDMALGKMLDKDKNQGDYKPYLRNINVRWGSFDLSDVLQMKFESSETDRYSVHKGDLLVCEGGEPGRCAVWNSNSDMMIQKALHRVRMFGGISSYYIAYVIESFTFAKILEGYYTGSTIKHLTGISLSQMLVPVPPLSEQCRIVNSVNIWQEIINKFNYNKKYLSKLLEQAKLKILDLAIHGKLVHQNGKDEPASKILKRINPNYKPADTSHYPFEIPGTWSWAPMSCIFDMNPKNNLADEVECGFVPMNDVSDGYSGQHTFETREWSQVKKGYCHFQDGDLAVAKISPCFENKKSTIFQQLPNGVGAGTTELVILRSKGVYTKFYLYLVKSLWYEHEGTKYFKGVVGQQRVNKSIFTTLDVPVPPLAEQKRIVNQIEKLLSVIDSISLQLV